MKEKVIFEVGLFGKSTITNGTFERPPSIVNVGMCFQVSRCWEWFPAQVTLVRFVLKLKRRKVKERERKRAKSGYRYSQSEIYMVGKSKHEMWQRASMKCDRASTHLSLLSHQFITAPKHKVSFDTYLCVCHSVVIQIWGCCESFTTHGTLVWFFSCEKWNEVMIQMFWQDEETRESRETEPKEAEEKKHDRFSSKDSPLWIRRWVLSELLVLNPLPQTSQTWGFSPVSKYV